MSKLGRKLKRKNVSVDRKEARKHYRDNRELGPCFLSGCENNGDFKDACRFCEFCVQSCTEHHEQGRNKAKRHLFVRHPAKTIPAVMMGVVRGDSLE